MGRARGVLPNINRRLCASSLRRTSPRLTALALDSLGKGKLSLNPLRAPAPAKAAYQLRQVNSTFEYRPAGASAATPPIWTFEFSTRHIHLGSRVAGNAVPPPLVLTFDPYFNHATLLGILNADSSVRLPALLHLPDLGTMRITTSTAGVTALDTTRKDYTGMERRREHLRIGFALLSPLPLRRCARWITTWK